MTGNRERNDVIDSHVLVAIRAGATRAAAVRKALAPHLEAALIWSDTWRRDPAEEAEEAARRGRDIDRSLKRLRNRGLIRHCCPDWEVVP